MSRLCRIIFLMAMFFHIAPSLASTFTFDYWYGRRYHINLDGKIEPGDDEKFKREVLKHIRQGHLITALQLNTPGGNVPAATSIGEQARLLQLQTVAPFKDNNGDQICRYGSVDNLTYKRGDDCECASACFLIWSGGVDRAGQYIGIHHPYFDKKMYGSLTPEKAEEMYMGMADDVRRYLTKMEISDTIINKMFRYISKEMYYMNADEIESLKNTPPWLSQLLYDRCGNMPTGTIYSNSDRKAWFECTGQIHEAIAVKNAQKYLDQHSPGEKVPTGAVTPQPPAPSPSPTPTPSIRWPEPTPAPPTPVSSGRVVYTDGPNANYLIRNNRDLDGFDLKPYLRNVDQNACAQACTDNNMCQGFSYDEWNHFCILKSNITASRLEPREISGVVRGSFAQFPAPVNDKPHFQKYQNAYFQGDGYNSFTTPDANTCSQFCEGDLKCVAYTFFRTPQTCRLFNSTSLYLRGSSNSEVGVKSQSIER